jgi:hypothetical protein
MDLMPEITVIVHREGEAPEDQEETKEAMPEKAETTTVLEDSDSLAIENVGIVEESVEETEEEESAEAE